MNLGNSGLFVVQLEIPSALFAPLDERQTLPNPERLGVQKAYWAIDVVHDNLGTPKARGLEVTAQIVADSIDQAEDIALSFGTRFSELISVSSGSPVHQPALRRAARVAISDKLFEQHQYYYPDEDEQLPRIRMNVDSFNRLIRWYSIMDSQDAFRVEQAVKWYGMAVGAVDSLDRYLYSWIGLESVGPAINRVFHPNGTKAVCKICSNDPGVKRDEKDAGIEHLIQITAPVLLKDRSVKELAKIRHNIAHGLAGPDQLRQIAGSLAFDLQLALAVGTLTAMRPPSEKPGTGHAALPRDYEFRPSARASLCSSVELQYRPFFGEWVEVEKNLMNQASRSEADGTYVRGYGVQIMWKVIVPKGAPRKALPDPP